MRLGGCSNPPFSAAEQSDRQLVETVQGPRAIGGFCRSELYLLLMRYSEAERGAILEIFLNWLTAASAFGGLLLGAINLVRTRSTTNVLYRWELDHENADVPLRLDPKNFEASLREGLAYLLPGADDIYAHPVRLSLTVRVDRRGTNPITVEYVELGDEAQRVSFSRQPGQLGSSVLTIDPNSHFEWGFDFDSIAGQLARQFPGKEYPPIAIRVSTGGGQKNLFLNARPVAATEVNALIEACTKVWPDYPAGR